MSFSCLITLASTSSTMLNKNGEANPCLVSHFRGKGFSLTPSRVILSLGLSYMAFPVLKYSPSIPTWLRVFNQVCLLRMLTGSHEQNCQKNKYQSRKIRILIDELQFSMDKSESKKSRRI